jgi:hypothetical protein
MGIISYIVNEFTAYGYRQRSVVTTTPEIAIIGAFPVAVVNR